MTGPAKPFSICVPLYKRKKSALFTCIPSAYGLDDHILWFQLRRFIWTVWFASYGAQICFSFNLNCFALLQKCFYPRWICFKCSWRFCSSPLLWSFQINVGLGSQCSYLNSDLNCHSASKDLSFHCCKIGKIPFFLFSLWTRSHAGLQTGHHHVHRLFWISVSVYKKGRSNSLQVSVPDPAEKENEGFCSGILHSAAQANPHP